MRFERSLSSKPRAQRLRDGDIPSPPIRGIGIRVEFENGRPTDVWPVEHSMVQHIEKRVEEGRRRRLGLVEWWGGEKAPTHACRAVADLFSRDDEIIDFALQAMREKIARDSE